MAESGNFRVVSSSEDTIAPTSSSHSISLGQIPTNTSGTLAQLHEKTPEKEKKEAKFWLDPEEFSLRKRLPPSLPRRNSDIYVTNKTQFKVQLDRCERLIDEGINITQEVAVSPRNKEGTQEAPVLVYLHSLGAAIPRALNLALQLQRRYGSRIQLDTITSTVELTDDFEPIVFEHHNTAKETITHPRYNSAVHIKISHRNIGGTGGSEIENGNSTAIGQEQ